MRKKPRYDMESYRKNAGIVLRAPAEEIRAWTQAAKRAGATRTEWLRELANRAAEKK